jgi:hypothetical protein
MTLLTATARSDGIVDAMVRRFSQSDFEFIRAKSNVPFLPAAWVTLATYNEGEFTRPNDSDAKLSFHQTSASQGAFVPFAIGRRDAIVIGEWISRTDFEMENAASDDLQVLSAAVPIGWIRQATPDWQVAAFVAPLGHKTHEDSWYWETLGGVFARHTTSDRVAWLFGAYFDVSPLEDFYTPYIGATFTLNERWSINAVMPWPAVLYAPNTDTLFRVGVTPSGTSWSIDPNQEKPRVDLSAWNFGVSAERRLYKNLWLAAEIGVSGIRGLSIVGGDYQDPETKLDSTGFVLLMLNFRPELSTD